MEYEDGTLEYYNSAADAEGRYVKLVKDDLDALRLRYGESVGAPKAYALVGEYFHIFPLADAVYPIKLHYYRSQTALTTNIENNWLKYAADLLIAETGAVMAVQYLQNSALSDTFRAQANTARARLRTYDEARKHVGMNYQMGDD